MHHCLLCRSLSALQSVAISQRRTNIHKNMYIIYLHIYCCFLFYCLFVYLMLVRFTAIFYERMTWTGRKLPSKLAPQGSSSSPWCLPSCSCPFARTLLLRCRNAPGSLWVSRQCRGLLTWMLRPRLCSV